ncbi:hypothetical protein, partial [Oenococcus oeni]|uniref:hypothetical protein n=1 Tax=Oenococcus oeni TaxID=1247 RepID=UPI00117F72A8
MPCYRHEAFARRHSKRKKHPLFFYQSVEFTVSKGAQKITVPTFDSLSEAQSWADQNGITLKIAYSQSSDTDTGYV